MKLAIGTAQFGMVYGISNLYGQTSLEEVVAILEIADKFGIQLLDTAFLYGNSEIVLGNALQRKHNFKIVTKTPHFNISVITKNEANYLRMTFEHSLKKLKQNMVYGLLIHNADDLLAQNGRLLFQELTKLKREGKVQKIGVSIYNSKQIDHIVELYNVDIIQVPINVLDQRLLQSGHLLKIKNAGIEIHARSVFLQGLLLMPLAEIPRFFEPIFPLLNKYQKSLKDNRISLQQCALNFVKNIKEIDYILVGVNNRQQLIENIKAYNSNIIFNYDDYACSDVNILNPGNWCLQ